MEKYQSLIVRSPFVQAALIFLCALVIAIIEKLINLVGISDPDPNSPWITFTAFILFFAMTNSVLSLKAPDINEYWKWSIPAFAALLILSGLAAYLFSGLGIDEAGAFRRIFLVLTFGYLVFLTIVRFMRKIVEIAIRQDREQNGGD